MRPGIYLFCCSSSIPGVPSFSLVSLPLRLENILSCFFCSRSTDNEYLQLFFFLSLYFASFFKKKKKKLLLDLEFCVDSSLFKDAVLFPRFLTTVVSGEPSEVTAAIHGKPHSSRSAFSVFIFGFQSLASHGSGCGFL